MELGGTVPAGIIDQEPKLLSLDPTPPRGRPVQAKSLAQKLVVDLEAWVFVSKAGDGVDRFPDFGCDSGLHSHRDERLEKLPHHPVIVDGGDDRAGGIP